jgi:hypothetical protein
VPCKLSCCMPCPTPASWFILGAGCFSCLLDVSKLSRLIFTDPALLQVFGF